MVMMHILQISIFWAGIALAEGSRASKPNQKVDLLTLLSFINHEILYGHNVLRVNALRVNLPFGQICQTTLHGVPLGKYTRHGMLWSGQICPRKNMPQEYLCSLTICYGVGRHLPDF